MRTQGPITIEASTLSSGYLCVQTSTFATIQERPATILTQSLPRPCALKNTLVAQVGPGHHDASKRLSLRPWSSKPGFAGSGNHKLPSVCSSINYQLLVSNISMSCPTPGWQVGRSRRVGHYSHRSTSLSARSTPCLAPAAGSASRNARGLRTQCPPGSR